MLIKTINEKISIKKISKWYDEIYRYTFIDCFKIANELKVMPWEPPSATLTITAEKSAINAVKLTFSHRDGDNLLVSDLQIKGTNDATGDGNDCGYSP